MTIVIWVKSLVENGLQLAVGSSTSHCRDGVRCEESSALSGIELNFSELLYVKC